MKCSVYDKKNTNHLLILASDLKNKKRASGPKKKKKSASGPKKGD